MHLSLPRIAFFFSCFSFLVGFGKSQQICRDGEPQLRISKADVEVRNGTIVHDNRAFKPGDYEVVGDFYFICPCNVQNCAKICCNENYCLKSCSDIDFGEYFQPNKSFEVDVLTKVGQKKKVDFYSHFHPFIDTRDCVRWEIKNDYVMLENGSLGYSFVSELYLEFNYSEFCFAQDEEGKTKKFSTFPAKITEFVDTEIFRSLLMVYVVSAIFLLFTALAIVASEERKSNLGKLAVGFSLTTMVSYLVFAIYYNVKPDNFIFGSWICNIYAFIIYVSRLSPYFWLNSMCFENLKLSKRCLREPQTSRFFIFSSRYSTLTPALIFIIFRVAYQVLHLFGDKLENSINQERCYFQDIEVEMIVNNGPASVVSILSLIFLVITLIRNLEAGQDKERSWFFICVLLFIITVIPIIVNCSVFLLKNDSSFVSLALYHLNSFSGILVFLVVVTLNANVRKSLFCCRKDVQHYNEVELH
ncbi:uncharacterized protein LOC132203902 [Neocloeon triangulifer]|uniref:uncharacterized protein LOC132203902 n=1 Tax=Neocloeon triangulifer TaxID=2078957 RepID=UPI00286F9565|nr:uncharacterized protein LOC132203902 [Neocloeon triangulifer]